MVDKITNPPSQKDLIDKVNELVDDKQDVLTSENEGNCIEIAIGGSSGLPSEYQEVEYLESSGTQYIDTGIVPSEVDNIYIKFRNTTTNEGYLIGAADRSRYNYIGIHNAFSGYGENWGSASQFSSFGVPADTSNIHTISVDLTAEPKFYFDGELKATQSAYSTSSTLTLKINENVYGSSKRCSARYYSVKFSKNGYLICDYIPARRNSDNVLGMFDLVSQTFFTNQGTGDFTAGRDVEEITKISFVNDAGYATESYVTTAISSKQDTLVSGTNIKTINNTSILGSGNIDIQGGGSDVEAFTASEVQTIWNGVS